jgi:hypothetical protein
VAAIIPSRFVRRFNVVLSLRERVVRPGTLSKAAILVAIEAGRGLSGVARVDPLAEREDYGVSN